MNVERLCEELDGLQDGDGHFEVTGSGASVGLIYRLDPPYEGTFTFDESLEEICHQIDGRYTRSARGAGVSAISLFTLHTWESALTAKEGETLLRFDSAGVGTFKAE